MIETAAYCLAVLTVMVVPATLLAWLLLHAFAARWRSLGPFWSYAAVSVSVVAVVWGMYLVRQPLLALRFGVRLPLVVVSAVLLALSSYINAQVHKHTPLSIVFGFPEISGSSSGELLTTSIYSHMRHPRFAGMALAVTAMATLTNVFALYVLAAIYVAAISLIAPLEERELVARFGTRYSEYARRVPRFIPRIAKRRAGVGDDAP